MFDFLHVFERRTKGESRKAKRLTIAALERPTHNDSLPIAVGTIVYQEDDASSSSTGYSPIEQKRTMMVFHRPKLSRKSMDPSPSPSARPRPALPRIHSEPSVPLFAGRHRAVHNPRGAPANDLGDFSIFRQTGAAEGDLEEPFYGTGTEALRNVRDVAARRVPLYHNSSTEWVAETVEIVDPSDYSLMETASCNGVQRPPYFPPRYAMGEDLSPMTTCSESAEESDDHDSSDPDSLASS